MKKRFLALLLALVMVVALLPTIALAADETPAEPVITVTGQDILPVAFDTQAGRHEAP